MCGITGWVAWDRDLTDHRDTLERMVSTMACRGPDQAGTWVSQRAALGHRRLAVTDIPGGRQPMTAQRRDCATAAVVTFSGEIYNHSELRKEMEHRGRVFRTRSDTEVLLHAYLEWGEHLTERLVGMFAFAIWDTRQQELLLVRDRLGIKPLYYAECAGGLVFGSEPKALLANPLFAPEVDAEGLVDVFSLAVKIPGTAVYRGMHEVRPGWQIRASRSGLKHRNYWRLESHAHTDDLATTAATVHDLLAGAVSSQLGADVPVGTLLSGGLDSSLITALAAKGMAGPGTPPLATYSVDFADSEQDFHADALHISRDAPFVRQMVAHAGTNHTEVVIEPPSLAGEMDETLRSRDIPGVGDLDVSLYLLFAEIRKHVTVALSGEGADDIFGGYPWFAAEAALPTRNFPWSAGVTDRNAMLSPEVRRVLDLDARIAERYQEALTEVPHLAGEPPLDRRVREVSYLQITRFLPFLLDRKDRMSMRVGLEVRVPFCDHRVVEYAWNIPWALKCSGSREKGILRDAAAGLLPKAIVMRPKSGFPLGQSPSYLSVIRESVREMIKDPNAPAMQLLNSNALTEMVESGAWTHGAFAPPPWLPRALQLNTWLKAYGVRVRL